MAQGPAVWHTARALHQLRRRRSGRSFLLLLLALVCALIAAACAEGESRTFDSQPAATTNTEPTEPPKTKPQDPTPQKPTDPDEAMPPVLDGVTPNKATVGSVGPSITLSGENFVPRTIVQLDGAPLATTFVSSTELRATIPSTKLAAVATLRLSAGTSPPGGGASKEVTFAVENPVPTTTSLSPLSVTAGAGATELDVTGAGYVQGAKIVFGATDLTTTFVSSTALSATVPASLLQSSGSVPVKVVNPAPGGGSSTTIAFTVTNPSASVQSINPSAAFVGSAGFTMAVNGGGFVGGSEVVFNGTTLNTSFVNGGKLEATVPSSLLGAAGDFPVAVQNPSPGGGLSAPVVFRVQYPSPQAQSLAPSSAAAGSGPTKVTVTGLGFFITSQITFDNAPAATTYVDATHLEATLGASQLASATTISVRVVNPAPGGGTSAALSFEVTNGVPTITGLNPSTVAAGSADRAVTVFGSGFVSTSTVKSNGVLVASSYVSGSQLIATIPSSQLLYPGTVAITVTNPSPGGGTSAPRNLSVGCDTAGANILLSAVGQTSVQSTSFATAPFLSRFYESSSCDTTTIDTANTRPARYWVVQNTSGAPLTLSAWADCTADGLQGDAYLTFYRRPTVPATDQERLACATVIAEGINGYGGYSSPESGVSNYCPGFTKANGGGITLGVCEKAVVHVQAWSATSTTYTMPPTMKIKAE